MKVLILSFISLVLLSLNGCYKEELKVYVPPKVITARDVFYKIPGLYQVSDSVGNYSYNMRVTFYPDTVFENGVYYDTRDSVGIFNLDNQFDTIYYNYNSLALSSISRRPVIFNGYYIENLIKSNGSRWKVIDNFPDNMIDGDKIGWNHGEMWICFRLNNINYYLEDGVSYGDTVKFQKAVRIGD